MVSMIPQTFNVFKWYMLKADMASPQEGYIILVSEIKKWEKTL